MKTVDKAVSILLGESVQSHDLTLDNAIMDYYGSTILFRPSRDGDHPGISTVRGNWETIYSDATGKPVGALSNMHYDEAGEVWRFYDWATSANKPVAFAGSQQELAVAIKWL